ncbi:MAG: plastocyanin [Gloeobacterales cyanobacterium]
MNKIHKKAGNLIGFGLLAISLIACGGQTSAPSGTAAEKPAATAPETPAATETPVAEKPATTVPATGAKEILMGSDTGQLVYVPDTLTIKSGESITFKMNKAGPHNVVFEKVPGDDQALIEKLSQKKLLSKTGETVTVSFADAPKGEYDFYCVPHKAAGMKGKIIVE